MTLSRRNVIIGGVAAVWIVLLVLTFVLVRSSQQQSKTNTGTDQLTPVAGEKREATEIDKSNLLMNRAEMDQAIRDYNTKVGKSTTVIEKKTNFKYQLAPSLQKAVSPTPAQLQKVLGVATACNTDSAPATLSVYDLKSHWIVSDASVLAKDYGVVSPSYSLPNDANSFQYLFTAEDNSAFFSLTEPSGLYRYHLATTAGGATLDQMAQKDRANAFITQHKLSSKLAAPVATPIGNVTLFSYKRVLDDFKIVDSASVQAAIGGSICSIAESSTMGQLDVQVRQDGTVSNFMHNARTIKGSYKAKRISLDESLIQYADSQPVPPIVIPAGAATGGNVTIESVVLAYYDVGANFGQTLYAPMYITVGSAGGAQVISFFPAVSASEMVSKGLVNTAPKSGNSASQQQGTLGFAAPTPFAPPAPPSGGGSSTGEGGSAMLGCPGNLVDYQIQCGVEGRQVCMGAFSAPSSSDPLNACATGCKNVSGTVTYQEGSSPCDAFLQQKSIPSSDRTNVGPITFPGAEKQLKSGDQVTCSLNACPC